MMLRAQLLRQETALDSISPERAGGIMYDTLAYINQMQLQGANPLLISKIYASVAAMEADSAPVSDLTGQALRPGQVVVIASADSDNGSVYRYNGGTESRWTVVGKIGNLTPEDSLTSDSTQLPLAARQGKVLDEKLSELAHYVENPEYIRVYTDANDRFLWGIREDGSIEWAKGVPQPIKDYIGNRFTDEQFAELVELLGLYYQHSDPEGRLEVTIDADTRIVSYRKPDGTKVENVGIETPALSAGRIAADELQLSGDGVDVLIQDIKDRGFSGGSGDWSDAKKLAIPTPRCAVINFTTSDGSPAVWPTTKTADYEYWMQFWDIQGNYFKKRVIFNAQGNSSLSMPKKNGAIDICNDEWEGDDTFALKIGDWIPQDSFHLKGYYADYFIGVAVIGYQIFDRMTKTRDVYSKRDWIKYLLPDKATIGLDSQATAGLSDNLSLDNDARCFPDGFPCLVYLDGVFYGIFSWQLKKHRDNYQMNKNNANEIHLDGMISYDSIFEANGSLPWAVINGTTAAPSGGNDGIEVRNPKSLICVDGTKYDADTNRKELISTSTPGYDPSNANMVRTAQVRAAMELLSTYIPALQAMVSGGSTTEQIRAQIESYFDVQALIDYQIFGDFFLNTDGFRKNWQWMTWDGVKWMPEPYDLDAILGWTGWATIAPTNNTHLGRDMKLPTGWIQTYFHTEMEARYKDLRDAGILSAKSITDALQDWIARIGTKNYDADHALWPYDKAHYEYAGTIYTRVDSIFRVANWIEQRIPYCDTLYNY